MEPVAPKAAAAFAAALVDWQKRHGRNDLPWQNTTDAYRIWLSEVMLQQTQVGTVIPYFERFLGRFPDVAALAAASEDEVLTLWAGLGYYSRGRNLHRAARDVVSRFGGRFPEERALLEELPGVGRSTAAAIASFAYGRREAILDGNVKRVLARFHAVDGDPTKKDVERKLWELAEAALPARGMERYTQAIMDLGATICTRSAPACERCPVAEACEARAQGRQDELPGRKPRKAVPRRDTVMLLLARSGKWMLVQRPAPGIWGGLWSFPEMPFLAGRGTSGTEAAVRDHCLGVLGCAVSSAEPMTPLKHAFTHYGLTIHPWRCEVSNVADHVAGPGARWLDHTSVMAAAIPKPVLTLMGRLAAG